MKLYLISQDEHDDYDTYDSAVVAAEDEESARRMHPGNTLGDRGDWWLESDRFGTWALHLEAVKVEYLGEAKPGTEQSVICASFNAG